LFVPLLLGASVGFPATKDIYNITEWLEVIRPTYLSVAPTPLRAMFDRIRGRRAAMDLSFLRFAICGAAYLPEALRDEAERLLGVPVLEYYGLSEAGSMAANPAPPRLRKAGTVGLYHSDELAIVDKAGDPVLPGTTGAICITGPSVTPSRVGIELVESGPHAGWLLTGDLGCVDHDGYLTIVGRTKEIINRGGEKVSPYEVEKALLAHPDVTDAGVFGTPHPRLGENVAAAVVVEGTSTITADDLKAFVAQRLAPFKVPSKVHILEKLPRGATGKLLRSGLDDITRLSAERDFAEPDRMLEHQIVEVWQRLLLRNDVGINDDFFELGGDSLLAAQMLEEIEVIFKKQISQTQLTPSLTVRRLTDAICSHLGSSQELMTQVQDGTGAPFFFCHGDYVSRGLYTNRLITQLGRDRPIYLLHFYQSMHRPDLTIEEIAQLYLKEIERVHPEGPLVMGGYCNGALVAWELAYVLQRKKRQVNYLLLIEAPSLNARPLFRMLNRVNVAVAATLPGEIGSSVKLRGMRAIWHYLRGRRGYASGPPQQNKIALNRLLPKQKELAGGEAPSPHWLYLRTMARFIPKRLKADVICFIASKGNRHDTDPEQWKRLARSVEVVELPGTHHTVVTSEATLLGVAMRRAMSKPMASTGAYGKSGFPPSLKTENQK
ncbi:MAG: hypothetical protein JWN07_551, partial [Hyphomicrobiales bacterium]|nr:hypothetical protein [Hyphomicrobiales bacterium]